MLKLSLFISQLDLKRASDRITRELSSSNLVYFTALGKLQPLERDLQRSW